MGLNATNLDQRVWTGARNYNFKTFSSSKQEEEAFGAVIDDGKDITATGGPPSYMMFSMVWIDEEETKALVASIHC